VPAWRESYLAQSHNPRHTTPIPPCTGPIRPPNTHTFQSHCLTHTPHPRHTPQAPPRLTHPTYPSYPRQKKIHIPHIHLKRSLYPHFNPIPRSLHIPRPTSPDLPHTHPYQHLIIYTLVHTQTINTPYFHLAHPPNPSNTYHIHQPHTPLPAHRHTSLHIHPTRASHLTHHFIPYQLHITTLHP
jgi:hypothetical protein